MDSNTFSDQSVPPEIKTTQTSVWTENIIEVLKNIGDSCQGYKWMCMSAAEQATLRYNILMYILITIGPVSGILSAIATQADYGISIHILVTIFSFLAGVLSTIIKFSKLEQTSASCKSLAAKYASLEGNIIRQLSLSPQDRVNAGKYLEWVSTSYDELFSSAPLLPDKVYEKWAKESTENKPVKPPENIPNISLNVQPQITVRNTDSIRLKNAKTAKQDEFQADLNKYTDGQMKYQLSRLRGNS